MRMSILKDRVEALIEKYKKRLEDKEQCRDRYQTVLDVIDVEIGQLKNTIFDLRFAVQGGKVYSRDKHEPTVIEPAEKETENDYEHRC